MEDQPTNEASREGSNKIPSQQGLYSKIAAHSDKILETLFELLDSRNENIRMGAAKVLANKIIPDKRAIEVSGEGGDAIKIQIISYGDNDPLKLYTNSPNETGPQPPGQVPDPQLAPEGPKDNTGDQPTDKVG